MIFNFANPPGFGRTVLLLLENARRRSHGRRRRQRQILSQRTNQQGTDWTALGYLVSILFMAAVNVLAAFAVWLALRSGQHIDAESHGKIVVSNAFMNQARSVAPYSLFDLENLRRAANQPQDLYPWVYAAEAQRITARFGGSSAQLEGKLHQAFLHNGTTSFVLLTGRAQKDEAERRGKNAVDAQFLGAAKAVERSNQRLAERNRYRPPRPVQDAYRIEAHRISRENGGNEALIEAKLIAANQNGNIQGFIAEQDAMPGLHGLHSIRGFGPLFGSLMLLLWAGMLVCQGEGLELDA